GPELEVTPSAPANDAPIAEQIAAISSSAWNVTTPYALRLARVCRMDDAGVIGYDPNISRLSPAARMPATRPQAMASVPLTVRYWPAFRGARGTTCGTMSPSSAVSPKAWPAFTAATFAFAIACFLANFWFSWLMVVCRSRPYIHRTRPSAHMLR